MIITIHNKDKELLTSTHNNHPVVCEIKLTEGEYELFNKILKHGRNSKLNLVRNMPVKTCIGYIDHFRKSIVSYNDERTRTYVSLKEKIKKMDNWCVLAMKEKDIFYISIEV